MRAKRTAQIIRGNRSVEVIPTDSLLEISFGEYEGRTVMPGKYDVPDPDFCNFFSNPENYHTPPGGESILHMRERTASFVRSVMENPENEGLTFLMVSHGAAIRGILSGLQNLPVAQFWGGTVHRNCGVTKIHSENGNFEIEFENRIYY